MPRVSMWPGEMAEKEAGSPEFPDRQGESSVEDAALAVPEGVADGEDGGGAVIAAVGLVGRRNLGGKRMNADPSQGKKYPLSSLP